MFLLSKVEGELLMEDNSVADQDGERWITGTDVGLLLCHLYENSNAVRNGIDKALEGTVTNPVEDWLYNNEDLVIDEAWKHEWVDAVYPD
tara:strand:- start:3543 stop:3812 length:270 start_codon:yes stop_codon:yes gene_type:complete